MDYAQIQCNKIKTQKNCRAFKLDKSNAVAFSVGTTAVTPYRFICPVGLIWFAMCCGKMDVYRIASLDILSNEVMLCFVLFQLLILLKSENPL